MNILIDSANSASSNRSKRAGRTRIYTTFTIFSMKNLVMCKVYNDVGGIK